MKLNWIADKLGSIWIEVKRRHVLRAASAYAVGAWLIVEASVMLFAQAESSAWLEPTLATLFVLGFPVAIALAWFFGASSDAATDTGTALNFTPESPALPTGSDSRRAVLPALAVLPFANMSSDVENEYLADGMTEELINLLAQSTNWRVTARNSSFQYKNQTPDLREVGQHLGVGYIVEGSVRQVGQRLRITAQLITTADGTHVWSGTYERPLAEIFEVQDEVVQEICRVLQNRLGFAERQRVQRAPVAELDAWGLLMRAMQVDVVDDATARQQRALIAEALAVDPDYARAHAYCASVLLTAVGRGVSKAPARDAGKATLHVRAALAGGSSDELVLRWCAGGLAAVGQSARALQLAEQAMALTGVPDALLVAVLMWNGRLDEAYAHCRAIVAGMPDGFPGAPGELRPIALLGNLLMLGGQLDEALKYTQMDRGANPGNYFSHINAANVLGLLGRKDEAAAAWADAKDLAPALTVAGFRKGYSRVFVDPKLAEGFSDGLLAAGLE